MTTKNSFYVHIVLDKSGSMMANKVATMQAYHSYLEGLPADAVVSLTLFSSGHAPELLRDATTPAKARIKAQEYECSGGTALYDAIGSAVASIDRKAKDFDRIALVIQTDGEENSSIEFNSQKIRTMLQDKQDGEGWLVVFLGADQNAWATGQHLGMRVANTMSYDSSAVGQTMNAVSRSTMAYVSAPTRGLGQSLSAFSEEERAAARGKTSK